MIQEPSSPLRVPYDKPFREQIEAGFGSEREMECLCGLIRRHLESASRPAGERPALFEIGTHWGAGVCHFHAIAPELEIHSLNVLPSDLAKLPRQMASEIVQERHIGRFARERGIAYTQHFGNSRTFDWDGMAAQRRFDIVFVDGCHEQLTVMADTLNALKILKPGGLIIWHDCKAIDAPGREVLTALLDLNDHEFHGTIRHVESTWLAYAHWPPQDEKFVEVAAASTGMPPTPKSIHEEIHHFMAAERRASLPEKVRRLAAVPEVLFFSDHRNPEWPPDPEWAGSNWAGKATRDPRRITHADVVVFHLPQAPAWSQLPKAPHQLWIGVTMEGDAYYPSQADPGPMSSLDLLLSYHAWADVRLNFTPPGTLEEVLLPVRAKDPENLVCAFISNPSSRSQRERVVEKLETLMPVHHYGAWHFNREEPRLTGRQAKLDILRRYHFCLAFENCQQADYVTEKWYDCFVAGCVPVYFGGPGVERYAPGPGCFLQVGSLRSLPELVRQMQEAARNPEVYRRYFEWKNHPAPAFRQLYTNPMATLPLLAKIERAIEALRGDSPAHG